MMPALKLVVFVLLFALASPFGLPPASFVRARVSTRPPSTRLFSSLDDLAKRPLEELKAREAKAELVMRGYKNVNGLFEKNELVDALRTAREERLGEEGEEADETSTPDEDDEDADDDNDAYDTDDADEDSDEDAKTTVVSENDGSSSGVDDDGVTDVDYQDVEVVNETPSGGGAEPTSGSSEDLFSSMGGMAGMANMAGMFSNVADSAASGTKMPSMGDIAKIMSNPKAQPLLAKAQANPKIMEALAECMADPSAIPKFKNDPEIREILNELKALLDE
jgi:hypothetical protein